MDKRLKSAPPSQRAAGKADRAGVQDGYKRAFDLCVVGVAGILLAPFWLLLAIVIPLAIWLEDRGPVFYLQERVGLAGRPFDMIKFRSMAPCREGDKSLKMSPERLTKVGKLLRLLHLDELPQVVNILRGDMSLVGPRAEWLPRYTLICAELPEFEQRLRVQPGIAGLAQARGHYWSSPREKLRYDNLYIENLSPWLDLKLIFLCIKVAIGRGFSSRALTGVNAPDRRSGGDFIERASRPTGL